MRVTESDYNSLRTNCVSFVYEPGYSGFHRYCLHSIRRRGSYHNGLPHIPRFTGSRLELFVIAVRCMYSRTVDLVAARV